MRVSFWIAALWGPLHLFLGVWLYRQGVESVKNAEARRKEKAERWAAAKRQGFTVVRPKHGDVVVYADYFRREGDLIVFRSQDEGAYVLGEILSAFDVDEVDRVEMPGADELCHRQGDGA